MALQFGPHTQIVFGLLGNIVSFLVYLSPMPTFYKIFKKKSTEGFQSIPYSVALFSSMLLLYYGFLKPDGFMLITINSFGILIESLYLTIYMIYATRDTKIYTAKILVLFNLGTFGLIILFTYLFSTASKRLTIVGWICAVFSVSVFAAPLSIIRQVIRTKSVKFMPFSLSLSLSVCAITWLLYGLSVHDYFVAAPNIVGLAFGITQMIVYLIYRKRRSGILPEVDPKEQANATPVTIVDNYSQTQLPGGTHVNGEVDRETSETNTIELTV
uniref:Bidirectional sugar transporter SWEET n=1 Tax=Litchi chinensis TaxID=151069 RepID=A0A6C0G8Z2_LITCN|nr:sugar efflux transporter 11 [Litchi chinensis]